MMRWFNTDNLDGTRLTLNVAAIASIERDKDYTIKIHYISGLSTIIQNKKETDQYDDLVQAIIEESQEEQE